MSLLKGPQDAPLSYDLMSLSEILLFFHLAFANFLSDRLPFTPLFVWASSTSLCFLVVWK